MKVQKSKDQLKKESIERFDLQVIAAKKDIKELENMMEQLNTGKVKEVSTEATSVVMGIRRDVLMCIDSLKRVKRILKKGDTNE